MNIPSSLVKGDSAQWDDGPARDSLGNILDSSVYTLKYAIRGAVALDLTAAVNGPGWRTSISVTQGGTLTAGNYYWQAFAQNDPTTPTIRHTIGEGKLIVKPQLSAASSGYDGRSQAEQDLDAVQTAMRAIISGGAVQAYTIANRQVQKMKMEELIVLESKLKALVVREQKAQKIANGEGNPHKLLVRF